RRRRRVRDRTAVVTESGRAGPAGFRRRARLADCTVAQRSDLPQAGAELLADAGRVVGILRVDRTEDDPLGAGVAEAGQRLRDEARPTHDRAGTGVQPLGLRTGGVVVI